MEAVASCGRGGTKEEVMEQEIMPAAESVPGGDAARKNATRSEPALAMATHALPGGGAAQEGGKEVEASTATTKRLSGTAAHATDTTSPGSGGAESATKKGARREGKEATAVDRGPLKPRGAAVAPDGVTG